jgi:hypothetical protein
MLEPSELTATEPYARRPSLAGIGMINDMRIARQSHTSKNGFKRHRRLDFSLNIIQSLSEYFALRQGTYGLDLLNSFTVSRPVVLTRHETGRSCFVV